MTVGTFLWVLLLIYAAIVTAAAMYAWLTVEKLATRLEDTRAMVLDNNHWLNVHGRDVEELLKKQREGWHRDG